MIITINIHRFEWEIFLSLISWKCSTITVQYKIPPVADDRKVIELIEVALQTLGFIVQYYTLLTFSHISRLYFYNRRRGFNFPSYYLEALGCTSSDIKIIKIYVAIVLGEYLLL